ncbi:MAG: Spy/CpxP family protein refolding chaperone [Bacteroidota bacterium]
MKKLKFVLLLTVAALPVLLLSGCKELNDITSPEANYDSAQYLMIDYFDTQNAVEDATMDADMSINHTLLSYSFVNTTDFTPGKGMLRGITVSWLNKYDWNKHLGMIFKRLKLTEDQKSKVDVLVKSYHEAMKPLVKEFAEANKAIIEAANAKRKEIAEKVKAGTLTRAEAAEEIKKLNERVRNAIETNPATVGIKRKMCAARKELLDGVRSILDSDQQVKWDLAVSKMKSPC